VNNRLTPKERAHIKRVKECACSVCDAPPPSAAHHIKQSSAWTCVALCQACHQGRLGWHGDKTLWRIRKMDELDALNVTIQRLMEKP
jgi:hypothetical protein